MPLKYTRKLTDADILETVRTAMQACLALGWFPSKPNMRIHGSRGGGERQVKAREQLIASGEIVIPPEIMKLGQRESFADRQAANRGMSKKDRRSRAECRANPDVIVPPKDARYISPVMEDILAAEKAWKRVVDWRGLWRRSKQNQC